MFILYLSKKVKTKILDKEFLNMIGAEFFLELEFDKCDWRHAFQTKASRNRRKG